MQAIVITFDRLATRLLGCYGNEWIETPHFDRLASTATVFDDHFADSVGPNCGRAWITGRHAFRLRAKVDESGLATRLRSAGVVSRVITAEGECSNLWHDAGADRVQRVRGQHGLDTSPGNVPFARIVQAGCDALRDPGFSADKRLLWLHVPEMGLPPEGFATLYFEDFEERGIRMSEIPREDWPTHLAVAAGSMSLIDHWLGEFLPEVDASSHEGPTLLMIGAARGRAWMTDYLTAVPTVDSDLPALKLRDQEVKSPLILSVRGHDLATNLSSLRCRRFVQPADVPATLRDWFGVPSDANLDEGRSLLREAVDDAAPRDFVCFGDDDRDFGIRTADWSCLMRLKRADQVLPAELHFADEDWPTPLQLFAKPEDVWDVTDVSSQQPEVCERLVQTLNKFRLGR